MKELTFSVESAKGERIHARYNQVLKGSVQFSLSLCNFPSVFSYFLCIPATHRHTHASCSAALPRFQSVHMTSNKPEQLQRNTTDLGLYLHTESESVASICNHPQHTHTPTGTPHFQQKNATENSASVKML